MTRKQSVRCFLLAAGLFLVAWLSPRPVRADEESPLDDLLRRARRGKPAKLVVVFVDEKKRRFPPSDDSLKEALRRFLPADIRDDLRKAGTELNRLSRIARDIEFAEVSPRNRTARAWLKQFNLDGDDPALLFFDYTGQLLHRYQLKGFDSRPAARYRLRDPDLYALVLRTADSFRETLQENLLRFARQCTEKTDYLAAQEAIARLIGVDDESTRAEAARALQQDILAKPPRMLEDARQFVEQARVAEAMRLLNDIVRGFSDNLDEVAQARKLLVALRQTALYDNYCKIHCALLDARLARATEALKKGQPAEALAEVASIVQEDFDPPRTAEARKLLGALVSKTLDAAFNELSSGNLTAAESLCDTVLSAREQMDAQHLKKAEALKQSIQNSTRP